MKKRIFSMLLALTMVVSLFANVTFATNEPTLTVNAGALTDGKVVVTVDLSNNPGIAGIVFRLNYDNTKIVPESYETTSLGPNRCTMNYDQGKALETYSYAQYAYSDIENSVVNGTLFKIVFKTVGGDWEETALTLSYDEDNISSYDKEEKDFDPVDVTLVNDSVSLPRIDYTFADATKTYNGSVQALAATDFKDEAGQPIAGVDVVYENNENKNVGTYTVKAIAKKAGYKTETKTATLKIEPKEVTVTGLSAKSKVYDGTDVAELTDAALSGVLEGDEVSLKMPKNGKFASVNVANNISVSVPGIGLEGKDKDNYKLTELTGIKANIIPVAITVIANKAEKRVGTSDPEFTYTHTGKLVGNDKFIGALTRQPGEAVGKYDILQGTLALNGNYVITYNKAVFEILTKKTQDVTVSEIEAKTYGDAAFNVVATPNTTADGLGNFTYESSNENVATIDANGKVTIVGAGKTNITVKRAGNDEYAEFVKTQELVVNKMKVTVTADAKSKRVGTNDPELTYTFVPEKLVGNDTFTGALARRAGEGIGKYDILQGTLALSNNYELIYNKAVFEILAKQPQDVTVSEIEAKTYGDAAFDVVATPNTTADGLGNFTYESSNENVATIDANGKVTIVGAGKTNITVKRAGSDEYAEFVKTQELVVNKMKVTVTADAKSKRVGTTDPELTYTFVPEKLVGNDTFTGELTRQPGEEVGEYDILQGTLALSNNYELIYNKAVFEILAKQPQSITVSEIEAKTYGDAAFNVMVTPDATSELTNFTYASSNESVATIDANGKVTIVGAGETEISVTEAGNVDYATTTETKKLIVNKKGLEIKVDAVNVTYGDDVVPNITYTGFVNGENESVLTKAVEVGGYSQRPDAGEYDIVLSGAEAANYEISYVNAKLTVTKKDATVTELKVFDKSADTTTDAMINTSSAVISGVILGDDVSVDFTKAEAAFASAEPGANIVVNITNLELVGADAGNYNLTNNTFATTASIKDTITTADIAAQITALTIVKDSTEITLPSVPAGYKIVLKSSDNEAVITTEGKVAPVENNTPVKLIFTVINEADETDAVDTAEINVTVPASTKVHVTVVADGDGIVTGEGDYLKNTDVTVVATANSGYKFVEWSVGGNTVSTSETYTFKADSDVSLTAKFEVAVLYGGGGGTVATKNQVVLSASSSANGKVTLSDEKATNGSVVTIDVTPDEGYKVSTILVTDKYGKSVAVNKKNDNQYTFVMPMSKVTVDVVFALETADEDPVETTDGYTDVSASDWFSGAVDYMTEKGLMNGVSKTSFAPNMSLTRGMFVTILYRAAGEPKADATLKFTDVAIGMYYADAVNWVNANGIVLGVSETAFAPNQNITREQIATIMYRYAQHNGYDVTVTADLSAYEDAANVSDYAAEAMQYAVGAGYINGKTGTTLNPKDNATRAEIATILQRFIEANK